jgi:hypothetical protein
MTDFKILVVLCSARSGSNLLCSILREMDGNIGFFEIFSETRVEGLQWHPAIEARVAVTLGVPGAVSDSAALLAARNAAPAAFFDAVVKAAQDEGARSMTCKIFGDQLGVAQLDAILRRPGSSVIFLSRRRIDRYISAEKAWISGQYIQANSTELRPTINTLGFLRSVFQDDRQLDAMHRSVLANGVRYSALNYERDLDIREDLRRIRVSDAVKAVGFAEGVPHARPETWLVKQDEGTDWRGKIANGFQTAAALAGCGLLAYAEEAPLAGVLPTTAVDPAPARPAVPELTKVLAEHVTCARLSYDPVVTMTSIQYNRSPLADYMSGAANAFGTRAGLHFLRPSWSMERSSLVDLGQALAAAAAANPGHAFVALHASDLEAARYAEHGIRSIPCNSNIFADENIWAEDAPPFPGLEPADAVYVARLADWKNHHLTVALHRPLFVYGQREVLADPKVYDQYREAFPSAQFVNHLLGNGSHMQLKHDTLRRVMSSARVGLALSHVEGVMRASMEYLLSGLPIVSVSSIGGRDAFLDPSVSLTVEPTAEAVRDAVADLVSRRLTRAEVRRTTLARVAAARQSFVEAANRVAQAHLGPEAPVLAMAPLVGHINRYRTLHEFLGDLR